jgi:hypothetical protein
MIAISNASSRPGRRETDRRQRPGEHPFGVHIDIPLFVRSFGCGVVPGSTCREPLNVRAQAAAGQD